MNSDKLSIGELAFVAPLVLIHIHVYTKGCGNDEKGVVAHSAGLQKKIAKDVNERKIEEESASSCAG